MIPLLTAPRDTPFFDEDDIRRLCGLSVFGQADAMQRAGHVSGMQRTADGISGNVRGVWRRVDRVTVQTRGNRLQPECDRHGQDFCPHVGALLLQWLREPPAFGSSDAFLDAGFDLGELDEFLYGSADFDDDAAFDADTPEADIAGLLELETIATIREIARRRNVRVSGNRKADVIRDAAVGLVDPGNIDATLRGLSSGQRLLLDAIEIVSASGGALESRAFEVYRLLGGQGQPPMESLRHLGLVFNPDPYGYRGHMAILPDSVAQRLLPSERLATVLEGEWPRVAERQRGLALVSLLIIIAQEAQAGSIGPQEAYPEPTHGYIPAGFIVHPSDSDDLTRLVKTYNPGDRIRLIPPPAIPNADVTRLAAQTGQPEEVVDFAAKLLMTLGILNMQSGVSVEPTLLRRVLEMDAVAQLELLAGGWLRMAGWVESELLFGDGGPIRFAWNPRHVAPHFSLAMAEAVGMVVRLVGRMPFDDWYDAASFVETVEALVPFAAPTLTTTRQASQQLDLTWHGEPQPGRKLDLRSNEGWSLFVRALVDAVLSGPLNWLGLVDVQQQRGRVTGFRVRPTAPVIDGKPIDPALLVAEGTISVGDDLTIVVPAGSASLGPLAPILQLSDLSRVDAEGLHYQLTPNGLQALFEYGHDPASVAGLLADALGKPIPKAARAMIDDWWERYGQVRIYDELTLIELGDDLLLRELQAATSLGRAVVHQFTPRLIAIEDGAVEQIVGELGARGYAPRIVAGD